MANLATRDCIPCKGNVPPLTESKINSFYKQLQNSWKVVDNHHLEKDYKSTNFLEALDLTNKIGDLAESVNHHPNICLSWGKVNITIWTHKINGLTESDFIFAAKVDDLPK